MAPIADYWIYVSERMTIDVPFEQIELCNRTDPVAVYLPPTLPLVVVDVEGYRGKATIAVAAQVVTSAAVALSMISGDPSSAAAMQSLMVLGMQPCGQPSARQAMSDLRSLNPLYVGIDGLRGALIGNLVIIVCVEVLQLLGAVVAARALELPLLAACEVVRAPSLALSCLFSLYQGALYVAGQLLVLPDTTFPDRIFGGTVCLLLLAVPFLCVAWCQQGLTRSCHAYRYDAPLQPNVLQSWLARLLLPRTRIEPPRVRRCFAALVAPYSVHHALLPVLPILIPFLLSVLSMWHPSSGNSCVGFFVVVLVGHLAVIAFVGHVHPFRFALNTALFILGASINVLLVVLLIASLLGDPRFMTTQVVEALVVAEMVVQVVQMWLRLCGVVLELKLMSVPMLFLWTTRRSKLPAPLHKETTNVPADEVVEVLHVNLEELSDSTDADVLDTCLGETELQGDSFALSYARTPLTDLEDAFASLRNDEPKRYEGSVMLESSLM